MHDNKIKIGISSCLLGNNVRYDAGHKYNSFIVQTLSRYFEFNPICPEVGIGLGVPREPIQLVKVNDEIRVCGIKNNLNDFTEDLHKYGKSLLPALNGMCGFIFKKGSPSCGPNGVKVFDNSSMQERGTGAFAYEIMHARPEMPVVDEERLMNSSVCRNFMQRVAVLKRWKIMLSIGLNYNNLLNFHRCHEFLLLAHDEFVYHELEKLLSDSGNCELDLLSSKYVTKLMNAMSNHSTIESNIRVLTHVFGYFKGQLDQQQKRTFLNSIEEYRSAQIPLNFIISLFRRFLNQYPNDYIHDQVYFYPHPVEISQINRD